MAGFGCQDPDEIEGIDEKEKERRRLTNDGTMHAYTYLMGRVCEQLGRMQDD